MKPATIEQIVDAGLDDWRKLAQSLQARFLTADFASGLRFVTAVGEVAERAHHHPDLTLTSPFVDVKLVSHEISEVSQQDIELARAISEIAGQQGIRADPGALSQLELALDTADLAAVGPFWAALLTASPDSLKNDDVIDPRQRVPLLWFQPTDPHETPRQRFHIDLWVPPDTAQERIEIAVAAGGRVVDADNAPAFVVLADPEGNRVCVCTSLDR